MITKLGHVIGFIPFDSSDWCSTVGAWVQFPDGHDGCFLDPMPRDTQTDDLVEIDFADNGRAIAARIVGRLQTVEKPMTLDEIPW